MTEIIYDYITQGVDMLISGVILTAIVVMLRSVTILNTYSANQQATTDRLNYYKEYAMYDCTDKLLSPDVLSAMVYYKYNLDIVVIIGSNTYTNYIDAGAGAAHQHEGKYYKNGTEITYSQFVGDLGSNKKFTANLVEDMTDTPSTTGYKGGLITGLKFVSY